MTIAEDKSRAGRRKQQEQRTPSAQSLHPKQSCSRCLRQSRRQERLSRGCLRHDCAGSADISCQPRCRCPTRGRRPPSCGVRSRRRRPSRRFTTPRCRRRRVLDCWTIILSSSVLKSSGDRCWGTTVKWLSCLSLCVCVRTCFVGCPKVRPPLPTESTSQIVPTGPSASPSKAHNDAHALAPNRVTHEIKTTRAKRRSNPKHAKSNAPRSPNTNVCNLTTSCKCTM